MINQISQETKTCPHCGRQVPERRARCPECRTAFPMSCAGCGREVIGRVFCSECIEPGVYHWDRANNSYKPRNRKQKVEEISEKIEIESENGVESFDK